MAAPRSQISAPGGDALERDGSSHHSLALKYAMRRFRALGGSHVLDLGPAVGRNVQFLSPFITKLYIADLHQTLGRRIGHFGFDGPALDRVLRHDLPEEEAVELILAWDLLDYLEPPQVEVLGRHLARVSKKDCLVFLMLSTRRVVPERPSRFLILDPETLRTDNDSRQERPSPGFKEPDLERLMPAFEVETSFLLRSGIQEYVLTTRSAD